MDLRRFLFFSFRSIYISKLKVDRNLISRLGILLTELNFHWNMIVMEKNRDRVGDDSKSKGKPRARKTTPSWFFNAKRFHNRMARPGFLLFFRGDSSTFFSFFFTNPLGIFLSLSPLDHHRLLFFFDSILYLFQSFSNNQFLKFRRKLNYYIFKMELKFFFQNIRKIFARKYKLSKKEMINIVFTKVLDRKKYLSLNYSKTFRWKFYTIHWKKRREASSSHL